MNNIKCSVCAVTIVNQILGKCDVCGWSFVEDIIFMPSLILLGEAEKIRIKNQFEIAVCRWNRMMKVDKKSSMVVPKTDLEKFEHVKSLWVQGLV